MNWVQSGKVNDLKDVPPIKMNNDLGGWKKDVPFIKWPSQPPLAPTIVRKWQKYSEYVLIGPPGQAPCDDSVVGRVNMSRVSSWARSSRTKYYRELIVL